MPYCRSTVVSHSCHFERCAAAVREQGEPVLTVCSHPHLVDGVKSWDTLFFSSLPCIFFIHIFLLYELSSQWPSRIIWAFPCSVQWAGTCMKCIASSHCNICWFQDFVTGFLIPIKYLKQLLCEFTMCPQTRLVCFQQADIKPSRVYGSPLWILKLLLWRWLTPREPGALWVDLKANPMSFT